MKEFESVIAGLYCDDVIEFVNIPHSEALSKLSSYRRFRVRYDTADEMGYMQTYRIRDGLILRFYDLQMLRDNRVFYRHEGGYFSFVLTLSGSHLSVGEKGEEFLNVENNCAINYYPDDQTFEDFSRKDVRYTTINVLIKKSLLEAEFFDFEPTSMPDVFRPLFAGDASKLHSFLPIDTGIRQALQMLVTSDYTGTLRDRFIEAKVMELICLLIRALQRQEGGMQQKPLGARQKEMLEQARVSLIADLSSPPSIDELALKVGIGKVTLQERFKQVYGVTMRNYLLQKRMESAQALLLDRNFNVSQIAWQLGYEHACNFTTAFKDFYGLTPNAYRKLGSVD